jgi:hypothetical protein
MCVCRLAHPRMCLPPLVLLRSQAAMCPHLARLWVRRLAACLSPLDQVWTETQLVAICCWQRAPVLVCRQVAPSECWVGRVLMAPLPLHPQLLHLAQAPCHWPQATPSRAPPHLAVCPSGLGPRPLVAAVVTLLCQLVGAALTLASAVVYLYLQARLAPRHPRVALCPLQPVQLQAPPLMVVVWLSHLAVARMVLEVSSVWWAVVGTAVVALWLYCLGRRLLGRALCQWPAPTWASAMEVLGQDQWPCPVAQQIPGVVAMCR